MLSSFHRSNSLTMTNLRAAFLSLFFLGVVTLDAVAAEPRRVLMLQSFSRDYAPFRDIGVSFRTKLIKQSPEPIDLYEEALDTARFRIPQAEDAFAEYLRSLFAGRKLDLVATVGAPAAQFIQRYRMSLFPNTPMVVSALDERRIRDAMPTANDAVVAMRLDLGDYVENILRLRPDTKNIAVVIGASPLERYWTSELRREFETFTNRVSFTWLNGLSSDDILQQAANLPAQSAIFYTFVVLDANGVPQEDDLTLERLRAIAKVPVFGFADYQLGQGIVGGPMFSSRAQGERAADVALRILMGDTPTNIKYPVWSFGAPAYDWRELQRWDISESLLPKGSAVQFRQPNLWEQYRWQLTLIAVALVGQALLIGSLFYERRRRRFAEIASHQRMAELAHMNRSAAAGELSASIAHEINQPLAAIVSSGNAGLRWLANKTPNIEEAAASFKRIVSDGHRASEVIKTIRSMFKKDTLARAPVDLNELIQEVILLLDYEVQQHEISVRITLTDKLPTVSVDRTQLQQVILNLVRNAIEAMSSVKDRERILRVRSEVDDADGVIIRIEDSGPGIEPNNLERIFEPFFTTKPEGMGMGLSICRTIVEAHDGRLAALPANGRGTVFEIILPLPK